MVEPRLLADAAFSFATAALYGYVARIVRKRNVYDPDSNRANLSFVIWWYALAALTLLGSARSFLGSVGVLDLPVHETISLLTIVPLVAALGGLLYYLLYIHTGRAGILRPLIVAHVALYVFYLYVSVWLQPTGVRVETWNVSLDSSRELTGPLLGFTLFTILGPVLIAAIGYFTLFFRTHDRTTRYRIAVVSGAFVVWFGSALFAAVTQVGDASWWPIVSRLIALAATLALVTAYRPPAWLQERLGIRSAEGG